MTKLPNQSLVGMRAYIAQQIELSNDPDWAAGVIASNVNMENPPPAFFRSDGLIPPGHKPAKAFLAQIEKNEDEAQLQMVVDEIAKRLGVPFENWLTEFRSRSEADF